MPDPASTDTLLAMLTRYKFVRMVTRTDGKGRKGWDVTISHEGHRYTGCRLNLQDAIRAAMDKVACGWTRRSRGGAKRTDAPPRLVLRRV